MRVGDSEGREESDGEKGKREGMVDNELGKRGKIVEDEREWGR